VNTAVTLLAAGVASGTPLLIAALGETVAERAGVINLGLEGMMLVGAVSGYLAMQATGSVVPGVLVALAAGALMAGVHAFFVVTLGANQIVSGLGLTIAGTGLSAILGHSIEGDPPKDQFADWDIPGLSAIPEVGRVLFQHDVLVYLAFLLVPVAWFLLSRTRLGLHLRSVGENPSAADAVGIRVDLYRYGAVVFGGMLAGLAGAALSLAESPGWTQNMTAGRGFIAVALVIFGTWNPVRVMLGAYLFGALDVLGFRAQIIGVDLQPTLLAMIPYVATIVVLIALTIAGKGRRLGAPEALGQAYVRDA
jgi:simple sugar transport system permease protein